MRYSQNVMLGSWLSDAVKGLVKGTKDVVKAADSALVSLDKGRLQVIKNADDFLVDLDQWRLGRIDTVVKTVDSGLVALDKTRLHAINTVIDTVDEKLVALDKARLNQVRQVTNLLPSFSLPGTTPQAAPGSTSGKTSSILPIAAIGAAGLLAFLALKG